MKSLKLNGLSRLLAFVLIAVILISVISIAVGGKQSTPDNEPDSGDIGAPTDETDENTDGTQENENQDDAPPLEDTVVSEQKFYSIATGLEVSEADYNRSPIAFLVDSTAPLYGVSGADITVEIPLENGKTRLLVYHTKTDKLWKIGSLAASRDYVSSFAGLLGGRIIAYGNDDIISQSVNGQDNGIIDISKLSGTYNIENTKYIYTSTGRIKEALNIIGDTTENGYNKMPFIFSENSVDGTASAKAIILPYSDNSETNLYYSEASEKYTLYKSSAKVIDKLNGGDVSYKNVFILFANTTTYESADGKAMTIDTYAGGSGYYASNGTSTEINWRLSDDGSLLFTTLSGEILNVNAGNSYISYYKASVSSEVIIK